MTDEEFASKSDDALRITRLLIAEFASSSAKQTDLDENEIYNAILKALVNNRQPNHQEDGP